MTNLILQGARAAGPIIARTAGRAALAYANVAISNALNPRTIEGPRLESFHIQTSRDGAPMPRLFGRARMAGQVIWASQIKETQSEEKTSGKAGGPTLIDYDYSISFAVGLCEGEISGIGRIWANGTLLERSGVTMRVHKGSDDQAPDPIIEMIDGPNVPAFRGAAYVVFEDFPLDEYGARLPQLNIEVFRRPAQLSDEGRLESLVRGVNLIPGSGEFVYAPSVIEDQIKAGKSRPINMNNLQGAPDITLALDQLEDQLPNCASVSIIVSWFGTDIRAGQCKLAPGVETQERATAPQTWRVGGYDRAGAHLISSDDDGHAVYGGTPSDRSMIDLIAELKRRGFKVMLYPFILMDIDPALGQPAFPWRGRITAESASDVSQFFGSCQPADFGVSNNRVTYSGPDEDSFRRMILHYAKLASLAGGVESFVIGTEMRGLTTSRMSDGSYPAVDELMQLAADVRAIVGPQMGLTYAADWSEYFGHHSGDDVTFHLDPLWAHPAIDAVGIDAYFPLADWRSDEDHLDAALAPNIYDPDYLMGNMQGGEGYEWYYASASDRAAQIRTPITDGAYNEPWIYRYKDLQNFWSRPHYNRVSGVRDNTPTAWQPQSKPFWLTEIGCPAINFGANQPNVFWDPKSSESFAPYHSNGQRDDLIQRRYIEAFIRYWDDASGNNPQSEIYNGPMIDTDKTHIWCWDARPFPDFPARSDVWSDGPNWRLGHWLSGRVGAALLPDIVREVVMDSGAAQPDVSGLSGLVTGYVIDRPMPARSALEGLSLLYDFDVIEGAGQLIFKNSAPLAVTDIGPDDMAQRERVAAVTHLYPDADERPKDVRVHFLDDNHDYQLGMVSTQNDQADTRRVIDISAAIVMDRGQAAQIGAQILGKAQSGGDTLSLTLMPSGLALRPADIIRVEGQGGLWQIQTAEGHAARRITARRFTGYPSAFINGTEPSVSGLSQSPSAPDILILDIPNLNGPERSGPLVGAYADPFAQTTARFDGQEAVLSQSLQLGVTRSDLPSGPIGRRHFITLDIEIENTALSDLEQPDFLAGAQSFVVQTPKGWEVIGAQGAQLIAPNTYRLSGLLRGLAATDYAMAGLLPEGAKIVRLNNALSTLPVHEDWSGGDITLTAQSLGRSDTQTLTAPYTARHLIPLAPIHGRAARSGGVLTLSWTRQSRLAADDWSEPPLGEESELYRVRIYDGTALVFERSVTTPSCIFSGADSAAVTANMRVEIRQVSSRIGEGEALDFIISQ